LTTLAKAKVAKTDETFIVQASLTIVTYDHQNMFIVQATVFLIKVTWKSFSAFPGWRTTVAILLRLDSDS